jgi:hypothetical protein
MMRVVVFLAIVLGAVGVAHAYPQFQLSVDKTCTSCHLSPAGGNLLNENGLAVAESLSKWGTAPEVLNGAFTPPSWLALGGDFRFATAYQSTPENVLAMWPMQAELYANAHYRGFSVSVTAGSRPSRDGDEASTRVWSREHYVMWQSNPGENRGLYVRAGRFMPVFGLRFAEHPTYTRRYGGTPLYAETYGLSASYVDPKFEVHATGFIKDPLIEPVVHDNGGAVYGEVRLGERALVGAEAMVRRSDSATRYYAGLVGKYYVPEANLLLQAELQYTPQTFDETAGNPLGGNPRGVVGVLVGTVTLPHGLFVDVGVGHYDPNYQAPQLDRDCIDVDLHWLATSHVELALDTRFEMLAFGDGGRSDGYVLFQVHYRL